MILSNGSAGTDQFIHTDAPLYINYFFFHITNADDVLNHGAIPRLQQKGPYAFRYVCLWTPSNLSLVQSKRADYIGVG